MTLFFIVGVVIVFALSVARLASKARFPSVTGYLLAGIAIGPSVLGWISSSQLESLRFIETLTLGFIAFQIGKEFQWDNLRRVGPGIALVTIVQGVAAAGFVIVGLIMLGQPMSVSMILGGIATATAPAATALVIKEYNADGPLTRTLLQVVALDDALGIMVFGFLLPVAQALVTGVSVDPRSALLVPCLEILATLILGGVLGSCLAVVVNKIGRPFDSRIWAIGAILIGTGLAEMFGWSPLLLNMIVGAAFVNSTEIAGQVAEEVDESISPLYVPFFALSGAALNLGMLRYLGILGIVYLVSRSAGKVIGAWAGARMASFPKTVQDYPGIALLPQAGVSIGMVAMVRRSLPELADTVATVILGSVVVYEIIGPLLARVAIFKAGEANELS
jgi:Kef-type K+ transport system membrane component KefB